MASEGANIVRRQWWFGLVAALLAGLAAFGAADGAAARSVVSGVLAVLLGVVAAGAVAFRRAAPSATQAAIGLLVAAMLRWAVTGGVLVLAFLTDATRPLWIVSGVLLALLATTAAALTYKRR